MTYVHDAGYWLSLAAFPAMGIVCLLVVLLSKVGRAVRDRRPHTMIRTARRALGTSTPRPLELPRSLARSEFDPRRQPRPEPLKAIRW